MTLSCDNASLLGSGEYPSKRRRLTLRNLCPTPTLTPITPAIVQAKEIGSGNQSHGQNGKQNTKRRSSDTTSSPRIRQRRYRSSWAVIEMSMATCKLSRLRNRSEERRVGKECRSRWAQYQ